MSDRKPDLIRLLAEVLYNATPGTSRQITDHFGLEWNAPADAIESALRERLVERADRREGADHEHHCITANEHGLIGQEKESRGEFHVCRCACGLVRYGQSLVWQLERASPSGSPTARPSNNLERLREAWNRYGSAEATKNVEPWERELHDAIRGVLAHDGGTR